MNGQERNKESLNTLFSAKDKYADMYSKMSGYDIQKDSIGWYIPEIDEHFYSLYDLKKFLNKNKKNVQSSHRPIKSSINTEVVENFPDYMVYYAVYGEPGGDATDEDIQLFEEWRERNGYGWCYGYADDENEYVEKSFDTHPAFGLACETVPVVFEKIQSSRRLVKSATDTLHCIYVSDIRPQYWTKQLALEAIKNSVTNYGCYDYNGRTGMILVGDFDDIYHFIESNGRVVDEDYIYHWKEFDWDNAKKLDKRYIGEKPNEVASSRKHKISSSQRGFENVVEGTQYDDYYIDTTGMGILDVEHIISEIEGRGNQAVLTVKTSDGATQHTQFTLDDWKKYKNAVNGVDEFSRNSGSKGAAITDVWVTEVKGGSYVRNSRRPIKSGYFKYDVMIKMKDGNEYHDVYEAHDRTELAETIDYDYPHMDSFTVMATKDIGEEYGDPFFNSRRPIKSETYRDVVIAWSDDFPGEEMASLIRDKFDISVSYFVKDGDFAISIPSWNYNSRILNFIKRKVNVTSFESER